MSTYGHYQTDPVLENEGFKYRPRGGGWIRLRRSTSEYVDKIRQEVFQDYETELLQSELGLGGLTPEQNAVIDVEVAARGLIADWGEQTGPDGEPLPYSVNAARQVMRDLPELRRELYRAAGNLAHYRARRLERAEKNSGNSQRGKRTGTGGKATASSSSAGEHEGSPPLN